LFWKSDQGVVSTVTVTAGFRSIFVDKFLKVLADPISAE